MEYSRKRFVTIDDKSFQRIKAHAIVTRFYYPLVLNFAIDNLLVRFLLKYQISYKNIFKLFIDSPFFPQSTNTSNTPLAFHLQLYLMYHRQNRQINRHLLTPAWAFCVVTQDLGYLIGEVMTVVGQQVVASVLPSVRTSAFLDARLIQLTVTRWLALALCFAALPVCQGGSVVVGKTADSPFKVLPIVENPSVAQTQ